MITRILFRLLVLSLAMSSVFPPAACADGGKAKNTIYRGHAETKSGTLEFTIETNSVIFYLGTVNNKYHVLLLRLENDSDVALSLAKDQDSVELSFGSREAVKALLNLTATDRATWDGLEPEIRTAIAYPAVVEPHEEEGIYIYVPVGDIKVGRKDLRMPSSVIYTIKSLATPIQLRPPGVAAK